MRPAANQAAVREGSGAMFDRIAPRYDRMNRVLSLGLDIGWRRRLIRAVDPKPGKRVLDLATGTADLAIMAAARGAAVVGIDPSAAMLELGRRKARARKLGAADADEGGADTPDAGADTSDGGAEAPHGSAGGSNMKAQPGVQPEVQQRAEVKPGVALVEGDAQRLPYSDQCFDACMMAFGIRNVPDRARALREMVRVTAPGGTIAILELAHPRGQGLFARLARVHVDRVVPALGGWLAGDREYRYLQRSIEAFPPPDLFATTMAEAGCHAVEWQGLGFGACTLFVGKVAADSGRSKGDEAPG